MPSPQFYQETSYHPTVCHSEMAQTLQSTLGGTVSCSGVGVHSGQPVSLTLRPGKVDSGYIFVRTDVTSNSKIAGRYDHVVDTQLCTKLANAEGFSISTVEHVLAALAGAHITNAIIEVNGPEVPIMDGSSAVFSQLIEKAGIQPQNTVVRGIKILKPVRVTVGQSYAEFVPCEDRLVTMTFDGHGRLKKLAAKKEMTFDWDHDDFNDLLADARTFGFYDDAQKLLAMGLAKGASLENTVVIQDENTVMNPEGLRSSDELVRHKILDAVGDLALAGVRIQGHFRGVNSGHALNNQLLRALFNTPDAWC
ncbi:UDP-3-O-acyl-N-acetylglucosamine deacetylase [Candidatus Finniella inopinata]|nr:UDP-3-O-acyl-N-acetylglucosamine deacetylase [Candidatus Finniella inopinata]